MPPSSLDSRTLKTSSSASKEELVLPELKEKSVEVARSRPFPPPLQNDCIPGEILQSLTAATNAGPCPEYLLPSKKLKPPQGILARKADAVWQHPLRRTKLKYLLDQPISLSGAGRDISFLYDVKYVKGEAREKTLCPPQSQHSLQLSGGAMVPHKPRRLTDTLVPEEFHIVSSTGVSGLECYDDKYTTLLTDSENRLLLFPSMKPNKRIEVAQLKSVMETLLERAGIEEQEYKAPTKMHSLLHLLRKEQTVYNTVFHELIRQVSVDCADRGELLAKIRERYVQMLDQVARQMVDFYKDLVSQRMMDQRILEELHNFKNVIEELTRELCLVQEQDIKLTLEAHRAHKDLATALLEAEKNARIVEDYHELYSMQRQRLENCIKDLMSERDTWSMAAYDLALKLISRNHIVLAKTLYLHEKSWHQHAKHFIILLCSQDTSDLALLQKLTGSWRTSARKFKQEIEQEEEGTKHRMEDMRASLERWRDTLHLNEGLVPDKQDFLLSITEDFKTWQKVLFDLKNSLSGESLASKYDSLRIIRHVEDNWVDVSCKILFRHKDLNGKMPPEHSHMQEILRLTDRFHSELELRITGNNGEHRLETFFTVLGSVPEVSGQFSGTILQIFIFNTIQQWLLKMDTEIKNGSSELQHRTEELHLSMIRWMINLLIVMVPDTVDQDTVPGTKEGPEKCSMGLAKLELEAMELTKRLYRFCTYLTSCCKGLVSALSTKDSSIHHAKDLGQLTLMKRECYEWIECCASLLSALRSSRVKLLKSTEKVVLLEEESMDQEFIEPQIYKPVIHLDFEEEEEEEEKRVAEEEKEEEEEEPSTSAQKGPVIRFVGRDDNVHVKPLFEENVFTTWKDSAQHGTLAQKYLEAMHIIERAQEKLMQVETRAKQAEENFEEVNQKLHCTLMKNQELERELQVHARLALEKLPELEGDEDPVKKPEKR
ncbi:axonemal dynein light chain domain-containing protein 1 [Sorex fumeus]|uniref:axonemal dynein light chain domain-containing protein 1 n=1 Tax=Sorex fumeus TaxID=62283 RepID=UPI0024AC8A0A|nr:axonemal dynein light chain domain-containing protein 1 [Sorex fumeus]